MKKKESFDIGGFSIQPGEDKTIELPAASLYTHTPMNIPVHIINGRRPGPKLFITAGIHGNEIDGVEIIRRLLLSPRLKHLQGTLVAVPVVNVFGFITLSRYLPDRRDLNRSFPGSKRGSLAARLAHLLMNEVIKKCTHGIDLHTGAQHRSNLPQIRINLGMPENVSLAKAFDPPVILNANLRDGSMRQACNDLKIPILVYEGGEALRFDEVSIRIGVKGVLHVMEALKMIKSIKRKKSLKKAKSHEIKIARASGWVRAPHSGILRPKAKLGDGVVRGDLLGVIADPFGREKSKVFAPSKGVVIGKTNLPLVNRGDALFHIAFYRKIKHIVSRLDELHSLDSNLPKNSGS